MGRPWLRMVGVLLVATLPPLVAYGVAQYVAGDWLAQRGQGTVLAGAALIAVAWTSLVAVFANRAVVDEARSMLDVVQHGSEPATDPQRRLAATLEERNRQIAALATLVREVPISGDASTVVSAIVAGARNVSADPTWELAVLRVTAETGLPVGVYRPDSSEPDALDAVHQWASATDTEEASRPRHIIGPWGAFVVIPITAGEELRAVLMAPWEGRPPPSPSELDLWALLGQHASTAIEHTLLYARLRSQATELNRMAAVQSDFLRGVSHDLQTPLTSIRALADEVGRAEGLSAPARADLDAIGHQADRLRRMVGQLLAVSRLEAGALTPRQEVFRVEPIVRRTWEALRADRQLELVDEGPPHLAVGDPDRLEQAIWAVLDNAVKYSRPGTRVAIHLGADEGNGALVSRVTVSDDGTGMSHETLIHAFNQFYRADDARRLAPDGSGVGLYAARGLLTAMGGSIQIQSRLGFGTSVTLRLPAEPVQEPDGAPER